MSPQSGQNLDSYTQNTAVRIDIQLICGIYIPQGGNEGNLII